MTWLFACAAMAVGSVADRPGDTDQTYRGPLPTDREIVRLLADPPELAGAVGTVEVARDDVAIEWRLTSAGRWQAVVTYRETVTGNGWRVGPRERRQVIVLPRKK